MIQSHLPWAICYLLNTWTKSGLCVKEGGVWKWLLGRRWTGSASVDCPSGLDYWSELICLFVHGMIFKLVLSAMCPLNLLCVFYFSLGLGFLISKMKWPRQIILRSFSYFTHFSFFFFYKTPLQSYNYFCQILIGDETAKKQLIPFYHLKPCFSRWDSHISGIWVVSKWIWIRISMVCALGF